MQKEMSLDFDRLELYKNVLRCCGYTPEKIKQVMELGGATHLSTQLENLRGHISYLYHSAPGWSKEELQWYK